MNYTFPSATFDRLSPLLCQLLGVTEAVPFSASGTFQAHAMAAQFSLELARFLVPLDAEPERYTEAFFAQLPRKDRDERQSVWEHAVQHRRPFLKNTFRVQDRVGIWHWVCEQAQLSFSDVGWSAEGFLTDVTEQEQDAILHAGQPRLLKQIAEHRPLSTILDQLNHLVEELLPESLTGILGYDAVSNTVYNLSAPSLPPAYCAALEGLSVGPTVGSCGAALCRREPVIVSDIATDPLWSDFVGLALETHGLRACWSHPILTAHGEPMGTFAIYHKTPYAPREREREFLATAASLAGVAIECAQSEAQLRHHARHDALTGLPNRYSFTHDSAKHLENTKSNDSALSLVFLDLDRFKQVNDSLGHSFGDHLLTTIAQRLQEFAGPQVYRMGGDEFTILLPETTAEVATELAQRLRLSLSQPVSLDGYEYTPAFTVGISEFPGHADDAQSLLKHADIALHRAKEENYGGIRVFDPALAHDLATLVQLEAELRHAIQNQALTLHYQPQYAANTHALVGVEALLRWDHPTKGWIEPDDFLPLAEETGLILPLSEWVLHEACQQAKRWQEQGSPLPISLNLSGRELLQPDLVQRLQGALETAAVCPSLIGIEFSESALLRHGKSAQMSLVALKALGISLGLDNFGTGFSSLQALQSYPLDILTIDRRFIQALGETPQAEAVVHSIITLAHALSLRVVAEGVETQTQSCLLEKLGCDTVQGFYFSPALPASQLRLPQTRSQRRAA